MTTIDMASTPGQGDVEFQRRLYTDRNATRRGLHVARRDWVLGKAMQLSEPGDHVLEVGVGCGVFTEALSQAKRVVSAVDINPSFLANVSAIDGVTVHLRDATLPLEIGDHELAVCSEVLEHVPPAQSQSMLNSLFGALRPGGYLILTTPQRFASVELIARLFKFKPVLAVARRLYGSADELGHINLLTAEALAAQLRKAGFEIESSRRFGFYLPVVAEFGGTAGAAALRAAEKLLRQIPFARGLLWTQGWILRRPR